MRAQWHVTVSTEEKEVQHLRQVKKQHGMFLLQINEQKIKTAATTIARTPELDSLTDVVWSSHVTEGARSFFKFKVSILES